MGKKQAFTLAEILVTLGIIGVIASMTIPNLVQDIQDAQLKTAWKKNFADLNQATSNLALANAGSIKGLCPTETFAACLKNVYFPYLSYTKACTASISQGCWHKIGEFSQYNGAKILSGWGDFPGMILNNGSLVQFGYGNQYCASPSGSFSTCGLINIDINGFNKPNVRGKDILQIHIMESRLKPLGTKGDSEYGNCYPAGDGGGCAAVRLLE